MVFVLFLLVAVLVAAAGWYAATGRIRVADLAPAVGTLPPHGLPEDPRAADLDGVRLALALRGYRIEPTDRLLDALTDRLEAQEAEIARLLPAEGVQPPTGDSRDLPDEAVAEDSAQIAPDDGSRD